MRSVKQSLEKPWPYLTGAIVLALLNILLLATTGRLWKITSGFLYLGAGILEVMGFEPREWYYFSVYNNQPPMSFFFNRYTVMNFSVIVGAMIASLVTSEFKIKKIKSVKQLFFGFFGGILMGYGARLSFGCNIGAYFSAIPSLSLHGWVYLVFLFIGAYIGSKLLVRFLL